MTISSSHSMPSPLVAVVLVAMSTPVAAKSMMTSPPELMPPRLPQMRWLESGGMAWIWVYCCCLMYNIMSGSLF